MTTINQLDEEQKNCDETISSISQFYNIKNQANLIRIILNQKLSNQLFHKDKLMMFKIFDQDTKQKTRKQKIQYFAQKYSFERLCEKFAKPKGTNELLKQILQVKIRTSCIESHQTRKEIWMLASGAKYYMLSNRQMYKQLHEYKNYPDCFNKPIDLDLNRTVKKQNLTCQEEIESMKRILVSFSRRNPFIGYCQGLNFITNFILTMQFTQQQTFWLLSQLLQTIIPMDYYTNMIGVVSDQRIFIEVMRQHNKKIANKFEEVGLDPSVFTIEWFVCLFTSSMPFYLVRILWDRLIIEGMPALLKAGIILLQEFEQDILNAVEFPQIILLIQQKSKKLNFNQDQFNSRFEDIYINKEGLKLARELYRQHHIKQKLAEKVNKNKNLNYLRNIKCNLQWPICLHTLQKCKRERQDTDIWIMRQDSQPKFIHDYCQRIEQKNLRSTTVQQLNTNKKLSNLVIGRMVHICDEKGYTDLREKVREPISPQFKLTNQNCNSKYLENLTMIFQVGANEQAQTYNSATSIQNAQKQVQIQQLNISEMKQIPSVLVNGKSVAQLKKSKSIIFYKKFLNNNKQLGEIITKAE